MKRYIVILFATFMLARYASADNLIMNGSFEEPKDAIGANPTGWWSWNSDYNGITKDTARTGRQSVYFSKPRGTEQHHGIVYTYKKVKPDAEYVFSCYVKNSERFPLRGGAFGQITIEWKKWNREIFRSWGPAFGAGLSPNDWIFVTMSGKAPEDADSCNFVINYFNKDGNGTFYVDDATVEEEEKVP